MATQIFINLPVQHLERAKDFYAELGFTCNPQFTDEKAACMVVSDTIHVMLLAVPFFQTFTPLPVADARQTTQVLLCLSQDSRAQVEALVAKAVAAGGTTPNPPKDYGFMYQHGFQDPDGHLWELAYMDMSAFPQA
ncbi:VOC family protein [Acidovorax sp. FG27]|uniref:VOC family protein n=1 Tax=Acidovorax sp. FG27 TaxID=3133652 RepID=UPI0030EA574A